MEQMNALNRRRFLAGLGLGLTGAAAVPLLSGCGGPSSSLTPQPAYGSVPSALKAEAKQAKRTALSVLSQQQYLTTTDQAIASAYQAFAAQTGTSITNSIVNGEGGDFVAKQDAAVKAGNVQDMAFGVARFVSQLHDLGDIVDVSDVVASMEQQFGLPSGIAAEELKFDGKWFGIPFYTLGLGTFLRKDWLSAKGIKAEDLKTWDDARDTALEISDPSKNQYGWGITINRGGDANAFVEAVINAFGGAVNDDEGRKVIFDSPETIDAVAWIADIYTSGKYKKMLPPGVLSWTDTGNNEAWLSGTIGLTQNNASLYAQSKETKNPVYGNTALRAGFAGPATAVPLTTCDVMSFVIFKNAKNPELAKAVAQYLATGQAFLSVVKRAGTGTMLPAWDKVWTSSPYYLDADPIFRVNYEVVSKKLPLATSTGLHFPQASSAGHDAVVDAFILTDMLGQVVLNGVSVKSAVQTANRRMVQTFEQFGIKQ